MATTTLYRATDGSTTTTFTWSGWVKRSGLGVAQGLCMNKKSDSDTNQRWRLQFTASDTLNFENKDSGGTDDVYLDTNQKFRDTAAWYHIVLVYDTTQSEANRVKIYINGESVEDNDGWGVTNRASASFTTNWSSGWEHYVGKMVDDSGTNYFFNGVMAHVHCTYGTAYQASAFGETDSTSGLWVPISAPSVTYGSQGYFLKLASGAITTDSSGEGNTMTETGTVTTTKDNAMNNFATLNSLENYYNGATFSNGNNTVGASGSNYSWNGSTFIMTTGKWYFEVLPGAAVDMMIGISGNQPVSSTQVLGNKLYQWGFNSDNGKYQNNAVDSSAYSDTWDSGDYMGVYLDLDNNKLYLGKNGTIQNSGTGVSITAPSAFTGNNYGGYVFAVGDYTTSSGTFECNFGNGYFGTTAISGAVADAGGEGQFKYNPSTGTFDGSSKDFRALCTNNLATYG
jgi:hypothetical protein